MTTISSGCRSTSARRIVSLALRGLTVMAFYALVFDISYPTSLGQWILLAISLALAWSVSFAYRFLVNLASFWSRMHLASAGFSTH